MLTQPNQKRAGRGRIHRRAAEALLDAAAAPGPADPPGSDLDRLLLAASGAALPAELAGEREARAVFAREYRPAPAIQEDQVLSKALFTKAAVVKISVAVCGLSLAGVGAAAATGSLPASWQSTAHHFVGAPAPNGTSSHDGGKDGHTFPGAPKPSGSASGHHDQGRDDQDRLDGLGAALLGDDGFRLCKAAENGDKDDQGHDLDAAALQKLAKAANIPAAKIAEIKSRMDAQRDQTQKDIQAFCSRLAEAEQDLREGKTPPFPLPAPHAGDGWGDLGGWKGGVPSGWPSKLPSGLPSLPPGVPSGVPSGAPSGWPSKLPSHLPSLPGVSGSGGVDLHGGVQGGH
jgi:hypothetical protein